jgi:hypothetical protein
MVFRLYFFFLIVCVAPAFAGLEWVDRVRIVEAVPEDKVIETQFRYENKGSYPVKIKSVKSNCGCTVPVAFKEPIQPGQRGAVRVKFKIGRRRGYYESPIIVITDDPKAPRTVLKFRPFICEKVEVKPTFVFWRKGEPRNERSIRVKVTAPEPAEEVNVELANANVTARVKTVRKGREYRVLLTPAANATRKTTKLLIKPRGKSLTGMEYKVYARVL